MIDVIIKPTTRCNLNCLYCNLENIYNTNISIDSIKKFFATIVKKYPEETINIRWHGGEPLLMGLDFFNSVIECQDELSAHFENEISTNITLLNGQWIDFFKKNNFAVFTSLDGIGSKHDFQRNKSFKIVRQSLIDLKSSGVQNISVRSTVTRYNIGALEEVYDFCSLLQLNWTFSVIIPSGVKKKDAENLIVNPIDFKTIIIRIFDKWFMNASPIDIQPFQNIIEYFIRKEEFEPDGKPSLAFGPDENIYACSLLIGNSKYAIGKFNDNDVLGKFSCLKCSWQRASFRACGNCNFEFLCNFNRCAYLSMVHESFAGLPNYLCSCWKPIYLHILEQVTHEIDK